MLQSSGTVLFVVQSADKWKNLHYTGLTKLTKCRGKQEGFWVFRIYFRKEGGQRQ